MALPKKNFFNYFPLPKFLEMPAIGLDISDDAIRFMEITEKNGQAALGRFGVRPLPGGYIQNGEIRNMEGVIAVLSGLRKELDCKFAHVSLPEEKEYLYKTEVPKSGSDIRQYIELRIEENAPIDGRSAIFDYSLLKGSSDESDHLNVNVSVVPRKVIDIYLDALYGSGFTPLSLQSEAYALARSVVRRGDKSTYLIVDFGDIKTALVLVSEGIPRYASTLSVGGEAITNAIAKHFSVDVSQAKSIKEEKGYSRNKANMELFFSLMNTVSVIRDEINKVLYYWKTHQDSVGNIPKPVDAILLSGKNAALVGFDEYLSLSIRSKVRMADVWTNIFSFDSYIPPLHFLDSLDYAVAVGLAQTKTG